MKLSERKMRSYYRRLSELQRKYAFKVFSLLVQVYSFDGEPAVYCYAKRTDGDDESCAYTLHNFLDENENERRIREFEKYLNQ